MIYYLFYFIEKKIYSLLVTRALLFIFNLTNPNASLLKAKY